MIRVTNNSQGTEEVNQEEEKEPAIKINPAMMRHWESEIKTLRDAPRDADKLRSLLKLKHKEYEEATLIEDVQRLVTEIEMLKFVLCLVSRRAEDEMKRTQETQEEIG